MRRQNPSENSPSAIERAKMDQKIRILQIKIQHLRSDLNLLSQRQQKAKNHEKFAILAQLEQEKRDLLHLRNKKFRRFHRDSISFSLQVILIIILSLELIILQYQFRDIELFSNSYVQLFVGVIGGITLVYSLIDTYRMKKKGRIANSSVTI